MKLIFVAHFSVVADEEDQLKIITAMDFTLEICTDNDESAVVAMNAGAHRIELCDNLTEGGTTPSFGMVTSARENLGIKLHVMIRPRGGDFLYSDTEFDIMRRDIDIFGEAGVDGIVTGILKADGTIDTERTQKLAEMAKPMTLTFHRAFDLCADPVRGLEDIISAGATRLLTSGHKNTAWEGRELIRKLIKVAGQRIIIIPGAGINESNIRELAAVTGAEEFHLTARSSFASLMSFRREEVRMGGSPELSEYLRKSADHQKIAKIISLLKMI